MSAKAAFVFSLVAIMATGGIFREASPQDTLGNRLAAAERYAEVFDFDRQMKLAIEEMSLNYSLEVRPHFREFMIKIINTDKLRNLAVNSMVQVFTSEELNTLADFYGSPIGHSILQKFPEYMAAFMPAMQQELLRATLQFQTPKP